MRSTLEEIYGGQMELLKSDMKQRHDHALQTVQQEHRAALERHDHALQVVQQEHRAALERLEHEHADTLDRLKREYATGQVIGELWLELF